METNEFNKDRSIGDTTHKSIRDANELYIYNHSENTFKHYSRVNFPNNCTICPNRFVKAHQNYSSCNFSTNNWCSFKGHISRAEKMFGELIAFPSKNQIPNVDKFEKFINFRIYGDIHKYKKLDKFYVYDPEDKRFNLFEAKNDLRKKFIKNNKCSYCKCEKSVIFWDTLLDHIGLIEKRQHCYLILDHLKYNTEENQNKINNFFNNFNNSSKKINQCIADSDSDNSINNRKKLKPNHLSIESDDSNDSKLNHKTTQNKYFFKSKSEDNLKLNTLPNYSNTLNDLNQVYKRYKGEFEYYTNRLQYECLNNINEEINLDNQIIKDQTSFKLIEKNEIFENKETHIKFSKKSNLKEHDLIKLLNEKYENLNNYKIKDAEIILSIKCLNTNLNDLNNNNSKIDDDLQPINLSSTNSSNLKQNSFPLILPSSAREFLIPNKSKTTILSSKDQTPKKIIKSNIKDDSNNNKLVNLGSIGNYVNLANNLIDIKKENLSTNLDSKSYNKSKNEFELSFYANNSLEFDQYLSKISQQNSQEKK